MAFPCCPGCKIRNKVTHKNLTWITSYSHWFDEENIPFWDNYHKFVRHQSDDYPHNPNTEDLSQFSYTVRNNDYSLVYTVENNQLGLYKLTDLQQKITLPPPIRRSLKRCKAW